MFLKRRTNNVNEIEMVAPTGFGSEVSPFRLPFEGLALVTS
jgi:hypothetical protein